MLYSKLLIGIRFILRQYFKHIHIDGLDNLPVDKPIILACNHPSSFLEPIVLASVASRRFHFLVRGDIFKTKFVRWFLKHTHQVPIFRAKDGISKLRNNSDTFEFCYQAFRENAAIIIFSESVTQMVKRLRTLHRGTWRLAYNTVVHNPDMELYIVPTGVNFSSPDRFRSEVMISFGKPIDVRAYISSHPDTPRNTIIRGTEILATKMKEQMVHFEDDDSEKLGDAFLTLIENGLDKGGKKKLFGRQQLQLEQQFARLFSSLSPEKQQLYNSRVNNYWKSIKYNRETDQILVGTRPNKWLIPKALLLLIPGILGIIFNIIPFVLASILRSKIVRFKEFYAPIRIGLWFVFLFIQTVLIMVIGFQWVGYLVFFSLVTPLLIPVSIRLYETCLHIIGKIRYQGIKNKVASLLEEREALLQEIYVQGTDTTIS